jgi:hypothetical protein
MNKKIDNNYKPYSSPISTAVSVSNLKPNKVYYVYIDNNLLQGQDFVADAEGKFSGTFHTDALLAGIHTLMIADSDILVNIDWKMESKINVSNDPSTNASQLVLKANNVSNETQGIFQSFFINNNSGIFINKIGLFFKNKPNKGVRVDIRLIENGEVTGYIVPSTIKNIDVVDINVETETVVEFDYPIQLSGNTEYCLHVLTEDSNCELLAQDYGIIETSETISSNLKKEKPQAIGSLYYFNKKWEKISTQSISFKIYQCVFNTSVNGEVNLNIINDNIKTLKYNPLYSTNGSNVLTVYDVSNFNVNDTIYIQGTGVTEIDAEHIVTAVGDGYIETDNYIDGTQQPLPNFTKTEFFGGTNVTTNNNLSFDRCILNMNDMELDNTDVKYTINTTPIDRVINTNYESVYNKKLNEFENKKIILDDYNKGSNEYFKVKYDISSNDTNISPLLDLNNINVFLINDSTNSSSYLSKPITSSVAVNRVQVIFETIRTLDADFSVFLILDGVEYEITSNKYSLSNEWINFNYTYQGVSFSECQLKITFDTAKSAQIRNLRIKLLNS